MSSAGDNSGSSALPEHAEPRNTSVSVAEKEPDSPPPVVSIADDGRPSDADAVPVRPASGSEAAAAPVGSAPAGAAGLLDDEVPPPPPRIDRTPSDSALARAVEDVATPRTTHAASSAPVARSVAKTTPKTKRSYDSSARVSREARPLTDEDRRFMDEFSTGAACDRMNPEMRRRMFRYFSTAWLYIFYIVWGLIWLYLYGWQINLYSSYHDTTKNACAKPLAFWSGVNGVAGYLWAGVTVAYLTKSVRHPNPIALVSIALILFEMAWVLIGTVWVFHSDRNACVFALYDFSYGMLVFYWLVGCLLVVGLVGGYIYVILDKRKIALSSSAEREKRRTQDGLSDAKQRDVSYSVSDNGRADASRAERAREAAAALTGQDVKTSAGGVSRSNGDDADQSEDTGLLSGVSENLPGWYIDNFDGTPIYNELQEQDTVPYVLSLVGFGVAFVTAVVVYAWQIHLYSDDYLRAPTLQCAKPLGLFNFVAGLMGFIGGLLFIGRHVIKYLAYRKAITQRDNGSGGEKDVTLSVVHLVLTIVLALIGLFVVGWYVAGSVWTFGNEAMTCNSGLYFFTFAILVAGWSLIAASGIHMLFHTKSITLAEATRPSMASDRIAPL